MQRSTELRIHGVRPRRRGRYCPSPRFGTNMAHQFVFTHQGKGKGRAVASPSPIQVLSERPSVGKRKSDEFKEVDLNLFNPSCPGPSCPTRGRILDFATIDEEEEDVIQSSPTIPRSTRGRFLDVATINEEDVVQSSPSTARRSSRSTRGRVLDVAVSSWTVLTHEGSNPRSANRLLPRRHVPMRCS
jgi:hypothetical protein